MPEEVLDEPAPVSAALPGTTGEDVPVDAAGLLVESDLEDEELLEDEEEGASSGLSGLLESSSGRIASTDTDDPPDNPDILEYIATWS